MSAAIACPTCHKAFHTAGGRDWHVNAAYCKPTGPALRPSVAPATVVARPRHKAARRTRRTSRHPVPEGPAPAPRAPYVPMTGGDRPTLGTIVDYSCPMPEGFRLEVPGVSRAILAPEPERAYSLAEPTRPEPDPVAAPAPEPVARPEAAEPTASGAYIR